MWILNALDLALKFRAVLCSRLNPGCVQLYAAEERLGWSLSEKHFSWPVMPIYLRISLSLSMWLLDTLDLSLEFNAVLCSGFNPGFLQSLWFLNITDAASHCGGRWVDSGCVRATFVMSWVFTWACVCKYPFKLWSWTCYSSWQENEGDEHTFLGGFAHTIFQLELSCGSGRFLPVWRLDSFLHSGFSFGGLAASEFCITDSLLILFYFKFHLNCLCL